MILKTFTTPQKLLSVLLLSTIICSCASPTKYYWGEYENVLYTQYDQPGEATPDFQIQTLQADIQVAASEGKPLPPGFYAHLGYQYLQIGKAGEARQCFAQEKKNFPESAILMDRFLKKIK